MYHPQIKKHEENVNNERKIWIRKSTILKFLEPKEDSITQYKNTVRYKKKIAEKVLSPYPTPSLSVIILTPKISFHLFLIKLTLSNKKNLSLKWCWSLDCHQVPVSPTKSVNKCCKHWVTCANHTQLWTNPELSQIFFRPKAWRSSMVSTPGLILDNQQISEEKKIKN